MTSLVAKLDAVQTRLEALARQHKVPGASLGILLGDELLELTTGVANRNTGVGVTPNTLFQIGSNTKLYTTTLIMMLADACEVDLGAPVRRVLPEFRLADTEAAKRITVHHLLTHTSGIEGDHFEGFGRGDDCLERYVASLEKIGQIHAPGELFSYCNTGFCVAGRILEKLAGEPYHEVLRSRLLQPLGCRATTVLFEEMLAHRYAAGHVLQEGEPTVPPWIVMERAHAPAGSLTSSTPKEVLRFVGLHLDEGLAPDGARLLSADAVRAMQRPAFRQPPASLADEVGLGWMVSQWDGERVIGHSGGTIGQLSFLQVLPERRLAVCLLTNSTTGGLLWRDLGRYLFEDLAGVRMPGPPKPPPEPPDIDLTRYTGTYERLGVRNEVSIEDHGLLVTQTHSGPLAALGPELREFHLRPVDPQQFHVRGPTGEGVASFIDFDPQRRPRYFHFGGRASRRAPRRRSSGKAQSGSTGPRNR
jgi:CubicO group peptidase (beta-lactamase class C family)